MPDPSEEKVSRYCPECGKKVAATKSQFDDPQICPSCKTRVLFLDYPRDRPPKADPIVDEIQKRDPKIHRHLSLLIVAAVLALLAFCFTALLMGQLTLFFVLACVALVAGIVGVSIYLDSKSKANAAAEGFREMERRLRFHEENQTRLIHQLYGLKRNYDALVEEERSSLRQQHETLLREASEDRQKAAEEREEYGGAAAAMCQRLLSEVRKSIKSKLTPNNFATQKERFMKTVAFCGKKGYPVDQATIDEFTRELRNCSEITSSFADWENIVVLAQQLVAHCGFASAKRVTCFDA